MVMSYIEMRYMPQHALENSLLKGQKLTGKNADLCQMRQIVKRHQMLNLH